MSYMQEFREQWRSWVGAALGLSVGAGAQAYSNSLFAPHMLSEFGWSRALFALQGTLSIAMFAIIPVIGRLTDLLGSRRIAFFGVLAMPLAFFAFSLQTGDITLFFVLSILKMMIGATTATLVYCRVVALNFTVARGLALAVCTSAPALLMVFCAPILGGVIENHGWRAGYQALAVISLAVGLLAVSILPSREGVATRAAVPMVAEMAPSDGRDARKDYGQIFRSRVFWLILAAMLLCNATSVITTSQFGLMLVDQGLSLSGVPWLISLYAGSVVIGRFVCGLALDRVSPHLVATISMAMPAIGILLLSGQFGVTPIIAASVMFIGLAQGAEGDLVAYMVAHYFPSAIYGSVAGLISSGMSLSAAAGALSLSYVLYLTDSFVPFFQLMGVATLAGASLFMFLPKRPKATICPERRKGLRDVA